MGNNKSKNKKSKGNKENKGKIISSSKGEDNHWGKLPISSQCNVQSFDLKMKEKFNSIYNMDNIDYDSNPINICYSIDLTKDSYSSYNWLDNTFVVFKSIKDDILYLIYTNNSC